MHGNFEVVDTAGFSVFVTQTRQSRPGEVSWKPERCSRVQFHLGEKAVSPKQGYSRQARMALEQVCSLDYFCPSNNFRSN